MTTTYIKEAIEDKTTNQEALEVLLNTKWLQHDKSSPLQKPTSTSNVIDFYKEEEPLPYLKNAMSVHSEKLKDSEEEEPLKTHCKKTRAVQCKDSRIRQTFPEKLMILLSHEELSSIIKWLPHGKSFEITDPNKFNSQVLPLFFKNCKPKSFTRKLYRWGFRQITKGPDANSFFNENFLRNSPQDISKMHCHYSQKELQARNQVKQCFPLSECSSISTFQSPDSSVQSPSQSNLNLPQDVSFLQKVSTSGLSNASTSSTNVVSPHPLIIPSLSNLPSFPTQNIVQTNQCVNPEFNISAMIANTNLQQQHALAQMQLQESKARLIAGLKASITATYASGMNATLQLLLDQLVKPQQPLPAAK